MAFLFQRKSGWVLIDKKLKVWRKLGRISKRKAKQILKSFNESSTFKTLGIPTPPTEITLRRLCDEYLADIAGIKGDYTVDRESRCLDHFCRKFGSPMIAEVTPRAVEIYLKARGYKPYSAHNVGKSLRWAFGFAVKQGYLPRNPMLELRLPKIKKLPPRDVEPKVLHKVLNIMQGAIRDYFLILTYSGARPGEVCGLRAQDITANGIIFIARKTESFRVVPIHPKLKIVLRRLTKGKAPADFLFPGKHGGHQKDFKSALRRACVKAKVKVSRLAIRHTFGTQVLKKTGNLRAVQTLLGHSRSTTTERYTHSLTETLKKAVGTL